MSTFTKNVVVDAKICMCCTVIQQWKNKEQTAERELQQESRSAEVCGCFMKLDQEKQKLIPSIFCFSFIFSSEISLSSIT